MKYMLIHCVDEAAERGRGHRAHAAADRDQSTAAAGLA